MNKQYYALTSQNPQLLGWRVVGIGVTAAEAEREAIATLPAAGADDIYAQTDHRNLRVVSKTMAQRRYGVSERVVASYYETDADRFLGDHQEA
ncbi:MAG TPA: hypothetical protein DCQ64_20310 [Candidatus Rokubacteria bacterium]|nr:hypothetical protein [Candidatus Rokubacteria bacterium]